MLVVAILIVAATSLLAWAWIRGIDDMKDNHPDYKGEDFLNWNNEDAPWTIEEEEELKLWDVTLMDGLENEEWDNEHHNEDV